jgi:hypothetical protein
MISNTLVPVQWLRSYIEPDDGHIGPKHVARQTNTKISGIVSLLKWLLKQ